MVKNRPTTKRSPDRKGAPSPAQSPAAATLAVEAALCQGALNSADAETRAVWTRLGALHAFDLALARLLAPDAPDAVRRFLDLPFVEPLAPDSWRILPAARRYCLETLRQELPPDQLRAYHRAVAAALATLPPPATPWCADERELALIYHLLPCDPAHALQRLVALEQRATAQGRRSVIEAAAAICAEHASSLPPNAPEPVYLAGVQALARGNVGKARQLLASALRLAEQRTDAFTAAILAALGSTHAHAQNYAGAMACFERAYAIYERLGAWPQAAAVMLDLGRLLANSGQHDAANRALLALQCLARALPAPAVEAAALDALGQAQQAAGMTAEAETTWNHCRALYRQLGAWQHDLRVAQRLAALQLEQGQVAQAVTLALAALELAESEQDARTEATSLETLASAYRAQARHELRLATAEKWARCEQALRDKRREALARRTLGDACFDLGDASGAQAAWKRAIELSPADSATARYCKLRLRELATRARDNSPGEPSSRFFARLNAAREENAAAPTARFDPARRQLEAAAVVAFDTAALQSALAGSGPRLEQARTALEAACRGKTYVVAAATAAATILTAARAAADQSAATRSEQLLADLCAAPARLLLVPVDADLAMRAANLQLAHPGLSFDDACAVLTAQLTRADLFIAANPLLPEIARVPSARVDESRR